MRSALPKALQPIAGRPILGHVLHALSQAGIGRAIVVTGAAGEQLRTAAEAAAPTALRLDFVTQPQPLGTGDAVQRARPAVNSDSVLVINGDLGLIEPEQVRAVATSAPATVVVATGVVPDPSGMGRIVRRDGQLAAIVEEADATPDQRAIDEVNAGFYRFESAWLWAALDAVGPAANGERHLTHVLSAATDGQHVVLPVPIDLSSGPLNIEDRRDLARAEQTLRARIIDTWLAAGVTIVDPATTYIDADSCIGQDTTIEPGTHLRGTTLVGRNSLIGPNTVIRDSHVGDSCRLVGCTIGGSRLGDRVEVGPYSTLREGTVADADVHIGTHAETKEAHLHSGVRMGHFSYVGDAEVGANTNIGAGAITCNYDGEAKHRTVIGRDVFIGSDSLLVAPLTIGDGASTGAGSIVNKDVAAGARVVGSPARAVKRRGTSEGSP